MPSVCLCLGNGPQSQWRLLRGPRRGSPTEADADGAEAAAVEVEGSPPPCLRRMERSAPMRSTCSVSPEIGVVVLLEMEMKKMRKKREFFSRFFFLKEGKN